MTVPCGQCRGCRVSRRGDWSMRMLHEASLHEHSCFWTLTYSDEHLPPRGSLRMSDVSAFIKRLRARIAPVKIRFQAMSEYGPTTLRPHYHGLFFGFDFPDRELFQRTGAGELSYKSKLLSECWPWGHAECSDLTPRSVAYCAKHNIDKLNGPVAADFYRRVDPETGEVFEVEHESARYSNRPGLGAAWADKYEADCFPSGYVIKDGNKVPVPRYYKNRLRGRFNLAGAVPDDGKRLIVRDDFDVMSNKAKKRALSSQVMENSTEERLAVREELLDITLSRLKRDAI